MLCRLADIATARSGDKGDILDISLMAPDQRTYDLLIQEVSADRVRAHFAGIVGGQVDRYELPRLLALKFVLHGALDGGAAHALRADNLGKTLGAALLRLPIAWPYDGDPSAGKGRGSR
jgi:hypothetical protein